MANSTVEDGANRHALFHASVGRYVHRQPRGLLHADHVQLGRSEGQGSACGSPYVRSASGHPPSRRAIHWLTYHATIGSAARWSPSTATMVLTQQMLLLR